mmetsp:Transcript_66262/g.172339  ORF Transcript_66262/g.172339 Transcript_66262/m.172339 type:complete len:222 (-) Transcript_66262:483-1148(-)
MPAKSRSPWSFTLPTMPRELLHLITLLASPRMRYGRISARASTSRRRRSTRPPTLRSTMSGRKLPRLLAPPRVACRPVLTVGSLLGQTLGLRRSPSSPRSILVPWLWSCRPPRCAPRRRLSCPLPLRPLPWLGPLPRAVTWTRWLPSSSTRCVCWRRRTTPSPSCVASSRHVCSTALLIAGAGAPPIPTSIAIPPSKTCTPWWSPGSRAFGMCASGRSRAS